MVHWDEGQKLCSRNVKFVRDARQKPAVCAPFPVTDASNGGSSLPAWRKPEHDVVSVPPDKSLAQ